MRGIVRPRLMVAGLAAAGLLSACGSEQVPAPTSTQPTSQHGAYAQCLAEHGVPTPPAGPAAPPGVDEQTWAKAQQACADQTPGPAS
ncbi:MULTISPECIES: hypothetical protein [unclassified Mycobacterium]|uniref:hypothetical protein n=1 Tax=unclassified Mycobacterium TaxID=2642494 RepID=UPI0029C77C87|nr:MULTISPECIES: hypothetical protein [unclassified Mycobacterium]